jgi:hypothetical protein
MSDRRVMGERAMQEDVTAIHTLYFVYLERDLGRLCAPAGSHCGCDHHEEGSSHANLPENSDQSHLEKFHEPVSQSRHFLRVSSQHVLHVGGGVKARLRLKNGRLLGSTIAFVKAKPALRRPRVLHEERIRGGEEPGRALSVPLATRRDP